MSLAKPSSDIRLRVRTGSPASHHEPGTEQSSNGASGEQAPGSSPDGAVAEHLPTQDELPCCDGEPLESARHRQGMNLLIDSLEPWLKRRREETGEAGYVAGNMFLYFSQEQLKGRDFRGPDVMVMLGVEPGERKSWVMWHEGKGPEVVIELVSDTSQKTDKVVKPRVYRDEIGVREYYWFDPFNPEDFAGFAFSRIPDDEDADAEALQPNLAPDDEGRITSEALGLRLGPWRGRHLDVDAVWLRWYTLDGDLLLTEDGERADEEARRADEEARRADEEARRADEADRRADEEARRADRLADKLRELGLDPDQIL